MQLNDTLTSLMRRWYLVLVGLALTCGLGWLTFSSAPPRFEAVGSVLLMPSEATVGDDGNPYLYLGGMNDALDVLTRRTNATEVQDQVLENQSGATYVVERDSTTQSPIVVVTAEAGTNDAAITVLQDSLASLKANLLEMQVELSIPQERTITLRDLVIDDEASIDTKTAIQLTIVVVGAGAVGTLFLVGLIDGYLLRRGERRSGRHNAPRSASSESSPTSSDDVPSGTVTSPTGESPETPAIVVPVQRNPSENPASDRSTERLSIPGVNGLQPNEVVPGVLEPQRR